LSAACKLGYRAASITDRAPGRPEGAGSTPLRADQMENTAVTAMHPPNKTIRFIAFLTKSLC
jgi:hypothetical protein